MAFLIRRRRRESQPSNPSYGHDRSISTSRRSHHHSPQTESVDSRSLVLIQNINDQRRIGGNENDAQYNSRSRLIFNDSEYDSDESSLLGPPPTLDEEVILSSSTRNGVVPPASSDAIVNLPHICNYSFDRARLQILQEEECGICCDPLSEGVALSRLPCGHVYHVSCIVGWLLKHCTCPECRYELPTNDKYFEMGRQERMKNRKLVTCNCSSSYHTCFFSRDCIRDTHG